MKDYLVMYPGEPLFVVSVNEFTTCVPRPVWEALEAGAGVYRKEHGRYYGVSDACTCFCWCPIVEARQEEAWMSFDGSYYDYDRPINIHGAIYVPYIRNDGVINELTID